MDDNQAVGRAGEDAAVAHYEQHGYVLVARNWRVRTGEIDLICVRDGTVVFCEVKTRTSNRYGHGFEAVDWRKQRRLRALALQWLQQCETNYPEIRFDVADVDRAGKVELLEGCF